MIEKIRQRTVVEQVMEKIRELIATGEYKSGDKFPTEKELSESFGIGRSSIREAIKVFNYLGVLESQPALGTFVGHSSNISTEALVWSVILEQRDFFELIEVRGAIELWSIVALTKKYKEDPASVKETIDRLNLHVDQLSKAIERKAETEIIEADYNFHYEIIKGSSNKLMEAIYMVLKSFMFEEIRKAHLESNNFANLDSKHKVIIDAITSGDIHKAMTVDMEHIDNTEKSILEQMHQKKNL